jgi:drug/metabolite transporter (DMT)-like permease
MGMGETLTLISTVFWTLHITYTDIATTYVDTMSMMCVQLGFVTLLSSIAALWLEPQQWLWDHIYLFWPWLVYLSVTEGSITCNLASYL